MTCHCGHQMILDREFIYQALTRNNATKRWVCMAGHTKYDPPPQAPNRQMCTQHRHHALPCSACELAALARRKAAGAKGGRTNKGRGGNAFAPETWTCTR